MRKTVRIRVERVRTKNNETAAMVLYQDIPLGVEYFSRVKTFSSSKKLKFTFCVLHPCVRSNERESP